MLKRMIFILALNPLCIESQQHVGSRALTMGNADVALNDVYAYFHNPAGITKIKSTQIGLAYQNKFLLKEFQSQHLVMATPLGRGVISCGAYYFGYDQFRRISSGIGYAMPLFEKFSLGVQLNYHALRLPQNYLQSNRLTAEIGFMAQITDSWRMGVSAYNLTQSKWSRNLDDKITSTFKIGAAYTHQKSLLITLEMEKNLIEKLQLKGGLEYLFLDRFFLRLGASNQPLNFGLGFGAKWKKFQMDLGSNYHPNLGFSPHFSCIYSFQDLEP